jgi:hypothetical protein
LILRPPPKGGGEGTYRIVGEDFNFCRKAQAAGFEVWANSQFICSYLKTCDLRDLMTARNT